MVIEPIKEGSLFVLEPNAPGMAPQVAESAMLFAPAELAPRDNNFIQLGPEDETLWLASVRAFLASKIQAPIEEVAVWAGDQANGIAEAARHAPTVIADAILASRAKRLEAREKDGKNIIFRFFRGGVGSLVRRAIDFIPTPVGYGPGDALALANGVLGKDLLTGDHLDPVHRGASIVSAAIPGVSAGLILAPVSFVREQIEDSVHDHRLRSQGLAQVKDSSAWNKLHQIRRIQKMGAVRKGFAFARKNFRRALA